jgi:cytochrome c biogenesis protein CcdA
MEKGTKERGREMRPNKEMGIIIVFTGIIIFITGMIGFVVPYEPIHLVIGGFLLSIGGYGYFFIDKIKLKEREK